MTEYKNTYPKSNGYWRNDFKWVPDLCVLSMDVLSILVDMFYKQNDDTQETMVVYIRGNFYHPVCKYLSRLDKTEDLVDQVHLYLKFCELHFEFLENHPSNYGVGSNAGIMEIENKTFF